MVTSAAQAGKCMAAYKEAKKLEKMVEGVYWVSEGDDFWKAFASWQPLKKITKNEIARVLKLEDTLYGEPAHYSVESYKDLYEMLRYEIESYDEDGSYEDLESAKKLKKLISYISKNYGKRARLVMHGSGDGSDYFGGYHMIVLIQENGCVLGLKAETVWT